MPEGPEVLTICDQLNFYFSKRNLISVDIGDNVGVRYKSSILKLKEYLPLHLKFVRCKAKLIVFEFESISRSDSKKGKIYLCNTLANTGRWGINYDSKVYKHIKCTFGFSDSNLPINNLFYDDTMSYGTFSLITDENKYKKRLDTRTIGFLTQDENDISVISEKQFIKGIKKYKDVMISKILMDQKKVCSGIGNYLLSEILYASGTNPWSKCGDLTNVDKIYKEAKRIIELSYKNRGMSFRDYIDVNGDKGEFLKHSEIYGKTRTNKGEKVLSEKGPHGGKVWFVKSQKN